MKRIVFVLSVLLFVSGLSSSNAQDETRLLRFPAVHSHQVVFTYAGDLYTVSDQGGIARKLTTGTGFEMFARFSPDGNQIAFTGQYDGNTEVFVMPAEGGTPRRITFTATLGRDDVSDRMGPNNIVMGWKDNQHVIFRSRKNSFNSFKGQLYLASLDGDLPETLPFPAGGFCSYSPDGKKLALNRVFREFRTWKYYRGGMADDIWIYDFETHETVNITNNPAQDIFPMWYGNEIYFLSDRDRIMNLFSYNLETGDTRKVTHYTDYDIKFPSLGDGKIIYENGGFLYLFDIESQQSTRLKITIADDFLSGRSTLKDASKRITSWTVSPDGKRLGFGARGDVWSVPASSGITHNLTNSSGVHDRDVAWSPDGKYIAYISDRTGEDELYIQLQDNSAEAIQLTSGSSNYKYEPVWAPDSKKLMWSDRNQNLYYLDIDTREITTVAESPAGEITRYTWSPDSRWIAYVLPEDRAVDRIWVYNLETKSANPVTDTWYSSGDPAFSSDGKYLFFSSTRNFRPEYSWTEWNHIYRDMSELFFVTLKKSTPNPFEPENDVVEISGQDQSDKESSDVKKKKESDGEKPGAGEGLKVEIDFESIYDRTIQIPGKPGYYFNITALDGVVYYCTGNSRQNGVKLIRYDLKAKKESEIGPYGSYIISANKKKMAIRSGRSFYVVDLPRGKVELEEPVPMDNMKVWVDLQAEWMQIFNESWRQMRDFFYDPGMHGVDWEAVRMKYEPLAEAVRERNDLNYVIGEMIGELNIGHAYVSGGDKAKPERIKMGLLGAQLSRDQSGYYRIDSILPGRNWEEETRSPLTEVGVDVKQGDYIISVNGIPVNNVDNIYRTLIGQAGKTVALEVNDKPEKEGAHTELVRPVADESKLYYYNWVRRNIDLVNRATDGQVGYIHIPDMSVQGLNEFVKYYYPQLNKRALIIDDRGNGGGNVSPMIIERLRRELTILRINRNGVPSTTPEGMLWGPKVMLVDQYSASDGDLFPFQFKTLGLGKVIGMRTWGGVVGIRGSLPFIDNGDLRKPEFATYDREGKSFVIEGKGVTPDIVIDNDPWLEFNGIDQQLNKAIEVILEELQKWPEELPPVPEYPDKSK